MIMEAEVGAGAGAGAGMAARAGAGTRAGVGAGARVSRTALRLLCKLFLEYLKIVVAVIGASTRGGFVSKGPTSWLDNFSPDLGGGKESRRAMERAAEGVT